MSKRYVHNAVLPHTCFGRLVVIGEFYQRQQYMCMVRCCCGEYKAIRSASLRNRLIQSCGCLRKELTGNRVRTHGMSHTREFTIWYQMLQRCTNPKIANYCDYGGRGISVCSRWRKSFANFMFDMGTRPTDDHSLDRMDNNGDYCPKNCRWATQKEQNNNTRVNRLIEFAGKTQTMAQWSEEFGINYGTLKWRLKRGWSVEQSLTAPLNNNHGRPTEPRPK